MEKSLHLEVRSVCVHICIHVIVIPISDTLQWTHPAGDPVDPFV